VARRNKPRSIGAEANLAERIRRERSKRGWPPSDLAKRMTSAGCSLTTSAVYKIEDREAPRRISVDELIALSQVLGTTVEDLLTPVDVLEKERARQLLADLDNADDELEQAIGKLLQGFTELFELAADDRELFEYVHGHRFQQRAEEEAGSLFTVLGRDDQDLGVDDHILRDGYVAFYQALIEQAGEIAMASVKDRYGQRAEGSS
jgi:transcriptional regulator with XRE-family HTH domain